MRQNSRRSISSLAMKFWKKSKGDDSAWKLQNKEQKQNVMYQYINLLKEGKLMDVFEQKGQQALEQLMREELELLFYNHGKGATITYIDYVRWKNQNEARIDGNALVDTRPDDQVLADYVPHEFNTVSDHEACWDLNQRGSIGETALHLCVLHSNDSYAAREISLTMLRLYPKLALDYYEGDEYYGESCLHIAIVYGDLELVKILVENGANVNQRATGRFFLPEDQKNGLTKFTNYEGYAYYGEYPLAFAACSGHEEIYDYLICNGADPNLGDSFGNTVLHMMVISNQIGMFGYAVKHHASKANMEICNSAQLTALTLASKLGRNEIFKEIIELQSVEFWRYSNITCSAYPLAPLDTIREGGKSNWSSALVYITEGDTEEHLEMLTGGVIKQLIEDKWKTFARRRFMERLLLAVLHLICLSIAIYTRPDSEELLGNTDNISIVRYIAEIITCLDCLVNLVFQLVEIRSQGVGGFIKNQMSAPAKCIFNLSCVLILLCIPFRLCRMYNVELVLLTFAAPFAWAFLLFFARGLPLYGPFVTMIYRMCATDMLRFVIIYCVFLIQFTQGFYFLFRDIENKNIQTFSTVPHTIMQLFQMTLGEFKYEDFGETRIPHLTEFVFIVFAILVPILLLNMLIAMMGNTYQQVISRSEKEWKRQWAKIIIVLERTFSREQLDSFQAQYSVPIASTNSPNARGIIVIKTSRKTKARQRKGAISNWKKLVYEVKALIKDQKKEGKSGLIDLTSSEVTQKVTRRQMQKRESRIRGGNAFMDEDPNDPSGDGLITAMTQLAWEKDIDLTKGKQFSATIQEEAEGPVSSAGDKTRLQKQSPAAKQAITPSKTAKANNSSQNNNLSSTLTKATTPKNSKADQLPLKDLKFTNAVLRSPRVAPEDIDTDKAIDMGSKPPVSSKDTKSKNKNFRPLSSKNLAASEEHAKRTALALTGSRTSLNSASSLTSLLHAWDKKGEDLGKDNADF